MAAVVEERRDGAVRIERIVQALKGFAHPGQATMDYADINELPETTLEVVNNEIDCKATVAREFTSLPQVTCLTQEPDQVVVNLLVGAAQAIASHGRIAVASRDRGDGWVEVTVCDSGCGIAREHLRRIFDPVVTTKKMGKGTGLGLNVVHSIVTRRKGSIEFEGEPGRGTTFLGRLPVGPGVPPRPVVRMEA